MSNSTQVAMSLLELESEVSAAITRTKFELDSKFNSDTDDNEESARDFDRHKAMVEYTVLSSINSKTKKELDAAKKKLDDHAYNGESIEGRTIEIYSTNLLSFNKKQNKDSSAVAVKDLVTELARAGVEKSVVDAALAKAEKFRRGNIYYTVETVDE